MYIEAAII